MAIKAYNCIYGRENMNNTMLWLAVFGVMVLVIAVYAFLSIKFIMIFVVVPILINILLQLIKLNTSVNTQINQNSREF